MDILVIVNILFVCLLIVLLSIIVVKYNNDIISYNNLNYIINKPNFPFVLSEKDPLRIKMVYKLPTAEEKTN